MSVLATDGYALVPYDAKVAKWAAAARQAAGPVLNDPDQISAWLRHQGTWFVGVDALPNDADGSVGGVALEVAGVDHAHWHAAQVSVVYPGYPQQDPTETQANHRFRVNRDAAHVDGLLPDPATGARRLKEPHGFILGLPLNKASGGASPLVVWRGSHLIMGAFFTEFFGDHPVETWADLDLSGPYKDARRRCFEQCARVELPAQPGEATLLHRHALHGVAPWADGATAPDEGRMIAYFRPQVPNWRDWL
ncbi:hypothetical protein [Algirhabdus cladophorae]|uniref:hypothetical protein n=1 Tax=Algirhabdus cladophorae TaxID=3377108 RepID=UPI003B84A4F7